MAVSCPARAFSKNARAVTVGSVTTEEAHQNGRGIAAEGVGEAPASALDLARAGLPERVTISAICAAGRADRAAAFKPPDGFTGISAERREAFLGRTPSAPARTGRASVATISRS
jgi:hypothetical protein